MNNPTSAKLNLQSDCSPYINLPEATLDKMTSLLNLSLATTLDLKTQIKQAHWNVKGPHFYQLHLLFDKLATDFEEYVDTIAERITALGGVAMGTARLAGQFSMLEEYPYNIFDGQQHVLKLVERFTLYANHLRESINQASQCDYANTADLYTQISREVDKSLWFLASHLHSSH